MAQELQGGGVGFLPNVVLVKPEDYPRAKAQSLALANMGISVLVVDCPLLLERWRAAAAARQGLS